MKSTFLLLFAVTLSAPGAALAGVSEAAATIPPYDHVAIIIEENHGFSQIIGNSAAPNLNQFATTYGLATAYYSVADPSAPNYVALLAGNYFGIADDNAYYLHTLSQPSLLSQLNDANLTWNGYLQTLPYPGYRGVCYPGRCNGVPDVGALYGTKHNGIPYFKSVQDSESELDKMRPLTQLTADLITAPPNFMYIVPDHCHDMHGSPPYCIDSGSPGSPQDQQLVSVADTLLGQLVNQITGASFWSKGNNAIVITFDEGNGTAGCCDAVPGTGRVATVVITNNGPRGLQDNTPYNHYSLLQTVQQAFHLGCLQFTCDTANVKPMAALFAVGQGATK